MIEIFRYVFPGMMLMWIFFIAQNAMSDILNEKGQKTLYRLLGSTASVTQVLLSKVLHCFLLCLISEFLLIAATWAIYHISWGNPLTLLLILALANLAFTGIVAVVYALAKNKVQADAIAVVIIMFSTFLGGGMMPFEQMPGFMQSIGSFTVSRWANVGLHIVMYSNPLIELLKPSLVLLTIGLLSTLVGIVCFKKRIESGELS